MVVLRDETTFAWFSCGLWITSIIHSFGALDERSAWFDMSASSGSLIPAYLG
jgi:hypothetical protein